MGKLQNLNSWKKIIYSLANKQLNQEGNISIEKMKEIIKKFDININKYIDYIFN